MKSEKARLESLVNKQQEELKVARVPVVDKIGLLKQDNCVKSTTIASDLFNRSKNMKEVTKHLEGKANLYSNRFEEGS